jgi:hypothetical protein
MSGCILVAVSPQIPVSGDERAREALAPSRRVGRGVAATRAPDDDALTQILIHDEDAATTMRNPRFESRDAVVRERHSRPAVVSE